MATISASCAMMQNAFPAGTLSLLGKFFVVEDGNAEPMIFGVNRQAKLSLVVKGVHGHNELINLSAAFGLDEGAKIAALAVTQSRQGLIHLVFAVSKVDGGHHELVVVRPMPADRQAWLDTDSLKRAVYTGQLAGVTISDILMGNGNDGQDAAYPQLFITLKAAGNFTEDIYSITVDNASASWAREPCFQLTFNPAQIISKSVGNIGNSIPGYEVSYRGLFVLYREASSSADLRLTFVGLDFTRQTPSLRSFQQPVPAGAECISSFDNPEGWTDLVVYADTLLFKTAAECLKKSSNYVKPTAYIGNEDLKLPEQASTAKPKQMSIAQTDRKLSIWTLDTASVLSYQEFEIYPGQSKRPPQALSPPTRLLEQGQDNDRFAAVYNSKLYQKVFVMDKHGSKVTMLHQSTETSMWQAPVAVMLPDVDEVHEYLSHTISIQADRGTKQPLSNQDLWLTSSIATEMIVNGVSLSVSPSGVKVTTDGQGSVMVIIPANGLSAPILTIKDVPRGADSALGGRETTIDPMKDLWDRLARVKTVQHLRDLRLPDGSSFVREDMSEKDLNKALEAIKGLLRAREDMAPGANNSSGVVVPTAPADRRWGAWHWIQTTVSEVLDWSIEKIGEQWKFVVTVAGQVWEFIVENYPQVAAGLQKILEIISRGWEAAKSLLERVFSWNDIKAVKNALVNMTLAGMILGADAFAGLETQADQAFQVLRQRVRDLKNQALPPELSKLRISENPPAPEGQGNNDLAALLNSPDAKFGVYHLTHSGNIREKSGVLPPRTEGETTWDRLYKRLSGIMESLVSLASRLGITIADIFSKGNFGLDALLTPNMLELTEDVITVMQQAVTAVLGSLSDLLLELASCFSTEIEIPVLGPLYKRMTGSTGFSVLDAVSLLLAIPGTLAYKRYVGPLPTEDASWQTLTQADAMKGVLDIRLGRVADAEKVKSAPGQPQPQPLTGSRLLATQSVAPSPYITMASAGFSAAPAIPSPDPRSSRPDGEVPDGAVTQHVSEWWAAAGSAASKFIQIVMCVVSALKTLAYKLPAAGAGGEQANHAVQTGWRAIGRAIYAKIKVTFSMTCWVTHGLVMWWQALSKIKDWSKNLLASAKEALSEVVFCWKFRIWMLGFVPAAAHLFNPLAGNCADAAVGLGQTILLVAMHVDVYAIEKVTYEWWRCPEEYINALAKAAVGAAVVLQGKEKWSLGFAFGLTTVGKSWTYIRLLLEMERPGGPVVMPIDVSI